MKVYTSADIRNIGFVSHQGAGKTSLTEALLFNSGAINRLGKVDDGNTVADYHLEETVRKITVNTSLIACEWQDKKINILDIPGFTDFFGEVNSALRVVDSLMMVIDGVSGTQVSTEVLWNLADEEQQPIIAFINKLDRENADFFTALDSMQNNLSRKIVAVQMPIGQEADFDGIVDLLTMKAYQYHGSGQGKEIAIPTNLMADAEQYRIQLMEAAAESNDELTMKYLDSGELTDAEIVLGLKIGIANGGIVPVLCGTALKNIGVDKLADFILDFAPNPFITIPAEAAAQPFAALIFKTMADNFVGKISLLKVYQGHLQENSLAYNPNKEIEEKVAQLFTLQGKTQIPVSQICLGDLGAVTKLTQTGTGDTLCAKGSDTMLEGIEFETPNYSVAIAPKSKGDEDKLGAAFNRILEEDRTLQYRKDLATKQNILRGLGETHIDIMLARLNKKYGVAVEKEELKIPYKETIRGTAQKVEGKHKKQSGGHGQYGHVLIDIAPAEENFVFEEKIFGGSVPKQYIPAVEKGIRESMVEGCLAGYPMTNIKVTLVDGSYHDVDSSEMAFKIAAHIAFKKACELAKPILLEPIMNMEIVVPTQYMGDIMSDLNTRRGHILGMEQEGKMQVIRAQAPYSEVSRYTIDLKSITQGRGRFSIAISHYEEVPPDKAEKIIAKAKAEKTE